MVERRAARSVAQRRAAADRVGAGLENARKPAKSGQLNELYIAPSVSPIRNE